MIKLQPTPEANFACPDCRTPLGSLDWQMPGMRNLAELVCMSCGLKFYGDLPAGQALYTPMLMETKTGTVHDDYGVGWFAGWLRESYAQRTNTPRPFVTRELLPLTKPVVLLNCLDTLYGHALLKLLNAQYYLDHRPDLDVIVLVQPFLEWMIPEGIAQAWIVDLPLRQGTEWNDWLAAEIKQRLSKFEAVYLSVAFSHPHPDDYSIERFTRVRPFPLEEWTSRLTRPTVTFIWRDDRLWSGTPDDAPTHLGRFKRRLNLSANSLNEQRSRVLELAAALRLEWPELDFAVAGLGEPGDLPRWMLDLRKAKVDSSLERQWCERYAASHMVVGVHGSNMLLPSAHAGSVVELIESERWGNFLQDILLRSSDVREMFFRYRFVPNSTSPSMLAQLINLSLRKHEDMRKLLSREFCSHDVDLGLLQSSRRKTSDEAREETRAVLKQGGR